MTGLIPEQVDQLTKLAEALTDATIHYCAIRQHAADPTLATYVGHAVQAVDQAREAFSAGLAAVTAPRLSEAQLAQLADQLHDQVLILIEATTATVVAGGAGRLDEHDEHQARKHAAVDVIRTIIETLVSRIYRIGSRTE